MNCIHKSKIILKMSKNCRLLNIKYMNNKILFKIQNNLYKVKNKTNTNDLNVKICHLMFEKINGQANSILYLSE